MPVGGGKYESAVDAVLRATGAEVVVLLVIGGDAGDGFSMAMQAPRGVAYAVNVPDALRHAADGIEADVRAGVYRR